MKKNETHFRTLINYLRQNVSDYQLIVTYFICVILGTDVDLSFE